jgi:Family of unknown function (DUF6247)
VTATYAYDDEPRTGHPLRRGASPYDIRAHLLPEDCAEFDLRYGQALAEARESLDLTGLFKTLENWRGKAVLAQAIGREGIRRMMEQAEHTIRTGEPPPGTVTHSADEIKALIRERLGH